MPTPNEIAEYLKRHPEFFAEHESLLAALKLPAAYGDARLHDRQVQVLRAREQRNQARLDALVDTARGNDDLHHDLHRFALDLLGARDAIESAAPAKLPMQLIKERFNVEHIAVFLESDSRRDDSDVEYASLRRRVSHLGSVCDDRVARKLCAALFPRADAIGSCAFVPVVWREKLCGVIVLGAVDRRRFQPDMGASILDRLGQLVGAHLAGRGLI